MPTYKVEIERTEYFEVTVEVDNEDEIENEALQTLDDSESDGAEYSTGRDTLMVIFEED